MSKQYQLYCIKCTKALERKRARAEDGKSIIEHMCYQDNCGCGFTLTLEANDNSESKKPIGILVGYKREGLIPHCPFCRSKLVAEKPTNPTFQNIFDKNMACPGDGCKRIFSF